MTRVALAAVLSFAVSLAVAAEPPGPSPVVAAAIQAQVDTLAQPDTAYKVARYARNLYEALISQGFNKAEALEIIMRLPLPGCVQPSK